jgi:hypothetical protein
MSSADSHWGTLINPDKSPAPLLEHLCLGIAQLLVSSHVYRWKVEIEGAILT